MDESETDGKDGKAGEKSARRFPIGGSLRGPSRREGRAYEWALEAAFAIPVGFGLGYLVDVKFGTGPIGLIVGGALGFAAFVRRLLRLRSTLEEPGGGDGSNGGDPGPAEGTEPRDDGGRSGS